MGWFDWVKTLKSNVKISQKQINIDNVLFRLHYRTTVWIILAFTGLVSLHENFGDKIRCTLSDPTDSRKQLEKVIDTFCFFMSTFTVPKYHGDPADISKAAHPGVGPHTNDDLLVRHKYYQWVPYFLFFQAAMFYIPHLIWRIYENKRLANLVGGVHITKLLDPKTKIEALDSVTRTLHTRLALYQDWVKWLSACEILNLIHLIFQWWLTDKFLDGKFVNLGPTWQASYENSSYNHLETVFPKVAKCTFRKYGPSGSLQTHDALCVLGMNVINEKVFLMLWYWFIFLSIATIIAVLHRFLSFVLYNSKVKYNATSISLQLLCKLPSRDLVAVLKNVNYCEWHFLKSFLVNVDKFNAKTIFHELAETYRGSTPFQTPPDVRQPKDDDYHTRETMRLEKQALL